MKTIILIVSFLLVPYLGTLGQNSNFTPKHSLPIKDVSVNSTLTSTADIIDLGSMNINKKDKYNPPYASMICLYLAGAADGTVEILRHDYDNFKKVFPKASDSYWNTDISWKNKWKNGNPENGEKFFQSAYLLAWTTDGYHLLRSANKALICGAITLKIGDRHRPWRYYLYDFVLCSATYTAGFTTTYSLIFKH